MREPEKEPGPPYLANQRSNERVSQLDWDGVAELFREILRFAFIFGAVNFSSFSTQSAAAAMWGDQRTRLNKGLAAQVDPE